MTTQLASLQRWVDDVARLVQPDRIHWCDGSEAERDALVETMLQTGDLLRLRRDEREQQTENDVSGTGHGGCAASVL